ncbi:MAG: hypothetical protein GY847_33075 [Proteobacteria bacterium]|nr:hypothetical protein [Pseudomonadota bacterium]
MLLRGCGFGVILCGFAILCCSSDSDETTDNDGDDETNRDDIDVDFDYSDLSVLNDDIFPSADRVMESMQTMVDFGPRLTGSPAHNAFIDHIEQWMKDIGAVNIGRDKIDFQLDTPTEKWGLVLHENGADTTINAAFYYPHSGLTPTEGVTGELVEDSDDITDKIVLLNGSEGSGTSAVTGIDLTGARKRGAIGGIVIVDESYDAFKGNYAPFSFGWQNFPAVYVDREVGTMLKTKAGTGATVTLTMSNGTENGRRKNGTTYHVYGILEGVSDELIILGVHTDGQNAVEENGVIALMEIAEYFSKIPKQYRKRSLLLAFPAGHMADMPYAEGAGFALLHPELMSRVVAAVAPEHIGATDWREDKSTGELKNVGLEPPFFGRATGPLAELADKFEAELDLDLGLSSPDIVMIGSGIFWKNAGVREVAGWIWFPHYLVNLDRNMETVDKDRTIKEVRLAAKFVGAIDGMDLPTGLDTDPDTDTDSDNDDKKQEGEVCTTNIQILVNISGICKNVGDECNGGYTDDFVDAFPEFEVTQNCAGELKCCIDQDQCDEVGANPALQIVGLAATCTLAEECDETSIVGGCPDDKPICCVTSAN